MRTLSLPIPFLLVPPRFAAIPVAVRLSTPIPIATTRRLISPVRPRSVRGTGTTSRSVRCRSHSLIPTIPARIISAAITVPTSSSTAVICPVSDLGVGPAHTETLSETGAAGRCRSGPGIGRSARPVNHRS